MGKYFWDNKDYKCPNCGSRLKGLTSTLTEDLQQQSVSCENKDCGKIFDITYKFVLDTFTEYKEN